MNFEFLIANLEVTSVNYQLPSKFAIRNSKF